MSSSRKEFVVFPQKLSRQLDKYYFYGYDILGNSILLLQLSDNLITTHNIASINITFKSLCFNSLTSNRSTKNHINAKNRGV